MLDYFEPVLDSVGTVFLGRGGGGGGGGGAGLCDNLYNKLWFWCFWAGSGHGFWFHKVEPMLGDWAAHGQPTARLGTIKNSPGLLGWTENGPCVL